MEINAIPGQNRLKKDVNAQLSSGNWPHTALISGPKGVPALAFALAISRKLLLDSLPEEEKNRVAGKVDKLIHPDLHISFPFFGSINKSDDFLPEWREECLKNPFLSLGRWALLQNGERKKLMINVKECTNIIQKLSLKAFEGGAKVLIIWGADWLGKEGNRLLKLLEEPAPNTYIILVAEELDRILPTVMSRCQMYKLLPTAHNEIKDWLIETHSINVEKADQIALAAEGSLEMAVQLISMDVGQVENILQPWIQMIRANDFESLLNFAAEFNSRNKESQKLVLGTSLTSLRSALTGVDTSNVIFAVNPDQMDLDFVKELSTVLTSMIEGVERNAHMQSLIMANSIRLWKWMRGQAVRST